MSAIIWRPSIFFFTRPAMRVSAPSLIDALEAGLPVVATAVGGIPEIIRDGENGILVKPDDPAALEAAVAAFHADAGLRARVAAANRLRAREFSPATMTGRYARAVPGRGGPPEWRGHPAMRATP